MHDVRWFKENGVPCFVANLCRLAADTLKKLTVGIMFYVFSTYLKVIHRLGFRTWVHWVGYY